jgi:predicted RNA-binding Zn-ribbon protein involved in translation (DUF1610 family)
MNKRDTILAVAAVIIVAVAGYYYVTHKDTKAKMPTVITANCACLSCKQHVRLQPRLTEPVPYKCTHCGKQAVYPLFQCRQCQSRFVPTLVRHADVELPAMPVVPACPSCGSTNVGSYAGEETLATQDMILPEWP